MFHFVLKRYLGSNLGSIWDLSGIYLGSTFVVTPLFRSQNPPEAGNEAVLAAVGARATQESALLPKPANASNAFESRHVARHVFEGEATRVRHCSLQSSLVVSLSQPFLPTAGGQIIWTRHLKFELYRAPLPTQAQCWDRA